MSLYLQYVQPLWAEAEETDEAHRAADDAQTTDPWAWADELGYDRHSLQQEIERLLRPYALKRPYFGRRQVASCGAWRSERLASGDESLPRFGLRLHLFHRHGHGPGRYLGYLSLRPPQALEKSPSVGEESPAVVLVATLAPPRHMLRARYHLILALSGGFDGIVPFRASSFCQPGLINTPQAQSVLAALHSALLLKASTYGCNPLGSHDFLTLAWEGPEPTGSSHSASDPWPTPEVLRQEGASLEQALQLLQHTRVGAGAVIEHFTSPEELVRSIMDYLAAGMPVVAPYGGAGVHRAALVLGMHLMHDPEEDGGENAAPLLEVHERPGRLVIHDLAEGPYAEVSTAKFVRRASAETTPSTAILAIGPAGMRFGVQAVRERTLSAIRIRGDVLETYRAMIGLPQTVGPPRVVVRMLQTDQVYARYFSENGVLSSEEEPLRADAWDTLKEWFDQICPCVPGGMTLSRSAWWTAEVRVGSPVLQRESTLRHSFISGRFRRPL